MLKRIANSAGVWHAGFTGSSARCAAPPDERCGKALGNMDLVGPVGGSKFVDAEGQSPSLLSVADALAEGLERLSELTATYVCAPPPPVQADKNPQEVLFS